MATYVTRDFGQTELSADRGVALAGNATALKALANSRSVSTDDVTGLVTEIDGLGNVRSPADAAEERRQREIVARLRRESRDTSLSAWIFNVNGIETDPAPARYRLHPGDVVQWDLRDWEDHLSVRATVGAFPETFTRGMFGDRFPTSVTCLGTPSGTCSLVEQALRGAGVVLASPARRARHLPPLQVRRARIFVGRWNVLRKRAWASRLDEGPRRSGVFARFATDGRRLDLLDWEGHQAATSGAGSGLVAAMRPNERELVWVITGVDDLGVERAARALDPSTLRNAFAVALTNDGARRLPLVPAAFAGG